MTTPPVPHSSGSLPPRSRQRAPKTRQSRPFLRALLWFIGLIGLTAVVYVGYLAYQMDNAIDAIGTKEPLPAAQPAKSKPLTFLLLGKDTRAETGSLNTDVIMVASLNPASESATLVSIPRDTLIKASGHASTKANAYYANFYKADKGKANSRIKDLFGKYLNVPIDYVAIVDFQGFVDIVDDLGGLDIDVDMEMCYRDTSDGTNIRLRKGIQHLDGEKTLDFVRYRYSNCRPPTAESGDLERNERQQKVLGQLAGKIKTPAVLAKLGAMIESAGKNVQTDIPSAQIRRLLQTYIGIDRDKIDYIHLNGNWESPYIYVDPAELKKARDALERQTDG